MLLYHFLHSYLLIVFCYFCTNIHIVAVMQNVDALPSPLCSTDLNADIVFQYSADNVLPSIHHSTDLDADIIVGYAADNVVPFPHHLSEGDANVVAHNKMFFLLLLIQVMAVLIFFLPLHVHNMLFVIC